MKYLFYCILFIRMANHSYAQAPRLVLPIGHVDNIFSVQFSPDGKKIITASRDFAAKIWDTQTGLLLASLEGHKDWLMDAAYSPDSKKVVTASVDGTARVWDAQTGAMLVEFKSHTAGINTARFSSDGKKIVTASEDGTAKVWDAQTGKVLMDSKDHPTGAKSARISPDGKRIVVRFQYSKIAEVWDIGNATLLAELKAHTHWLSAAEFSVDGKKILTASDDGTAKVWNAETGRMLMDLRGGGKAVSNNADGKKIITVGGRVAKIWDAQTGTELFTLEGNSGEMLSAAFSQDGRKVVTISPGKGRIWDTETGTLVADFDKASFSHTAEFSPDGKKIVTGTFTRWAQVWDGNTGKLLLDLKGNAPGVGFARYNPDGKDILTVTNDDIVRLWDTQTGSLRVALVGHNNTIEDAQYSPDGKNIVTASIDKTAKIWNTQTGALLIDMKDQGGAVKRASYSPDGKKILTATGHAPVIWDAQTGVSLEVFGGHTENVEETRFSPDGKRISSVAIYTDGTVRVWNAEKGTQLRKNNTHSWYSQISKDGSRIFSHHPGLAANIWDARTGDLLFELKAKGHPFDVEPFQPMEFSADGKKIVTKRYDGNGLIWDAQTGTLLTELKGKHPSMVTIIHFSPDGKKVITGFEENSATIFDVESGLPLADFKGHTHSLKSVEFSPDGRRVVTGSRDGTIKVWNAENGELFYTFFSVDSTDEFKQTPSGYYQCSANAAKLLHYVTRDLRVITFEQLDVKYNRPDKVLEAIGNTDTALIRSYRKAWEKRIKKLGIDTTSFRDGFSVPEADFINRDQIAYEQKQEKIALHLKGNDSTYKLDRFNVWINETPVFGQRGVDIRNRNSNELDTIITINLSEGENRIEVSITNVNGTESYRIPLLVNYTPTVPKREVTHFIGIGIDRFANNQYDLQYSSKDIRDLSLKLKEKYGNDITIDTLFNRDVNVANVKALKKKLEQTGINDKVIISYSGHGLLSKDFDYFLSTYAVNFEKPEENGLPYDALEDLLDNIPARKKLMLIDACHSGEVDKEELVRINNTSDSLQLTKGTRPVAYEGNQSHLGMKNSFELMQSLFVNVGKSTGATIISAAAGTQFALERGDLQNGVFTYSILEAMEKNKTMKISELKKVVGERVEQLTNGLQKPTSRNETIAVDWSLW